MKNKKLFWIVAALILACLLPMSVFAEGDAEPVSRVYGTIFSLLPPVIAIALALITKEVYSSLFIGILSGALLHTNFNLEATVNTIFFNEEGGMLAKLGDAWNVGILLFLVILGMMVALMNKAGGSAAFGKWASQHIHSRAGAQLATMLLGVMIFVDDYFNCLTVGSVMMPVTDKQKISRAKLAYLIDATAAPVCIIAPISSWAAAVTSSVPEGSDINGFVMFLQTIPFNFYAILTLVMVICLALMKFDFGPMALHEKNAVNGDLFTTAARPYGESSDEVAVGKGKVIDLVAPVLVLVLCCILGMVYTGGFFTGTDFITAFADCDASAGLVIGSFVSLIIIFIYYMIRRVLSFREFMESLADGFKAMVPAILILTFAWTLSGMTGLLGGAEYVKALVEGSASALTSLLPALIFLVAVLLAFATGTSWGTFEILVPIVCVAFGSMPEMLVVSIAAILAGAVAGDHSSPISDTTIMASAGARCDHVVHVETQIPYVMTTSAVCFVCYIVAGFLPNAWLVLPLAIVLQVGLLFLIRHITQKKA